MDIQNLTEKDIKNLSLEEKKEFVRNLIHSEAACAAFFNPLTKETIKMDELVEHMGEEKAIEMMVAALEKIDTKSISLEAKDIKELEQKARRGECNSDELAMLEFVHKEVMAKDSVQFEHNHIQLTCDMINYVQQNIGYTPGFDDLISSMVVLTLISRIHTKGSLMNKYEHADPTAVSEMIHLTANDIYDTWKASCSSESNPELVVISLLHLASKIAHEENMIIPDIKDIAPYLEVSIDNLDDDSDDDTENGSNEMPNVCQPVSYTSASESSYMSDDKDEEMRDLLKD